MQPKNFAIIGAAGYVGPKHIQAIHETGNRLIAVFDPNDNLEILDTYFPACEYFNNREDFGVFLDQQQNTPQQVDYVVICSPSNLHHQHALFALDKGCHVICESPLVLSTGAIEQLIDKEEQSGKTVFPFLQYQEHPVIRQLKKIRDEHRTPDPLAIGLTSITSRGKWYLKSWKGNPEKSGGITTILGFHYFQLLIGLFGPIIHFEQSEKKEDQSSGLLKLEKATINWFFSINPNDLPKNAIQKGDKKYAQLTINDQAIDLDADESLFYQTYQAILGRQTPRISQLKSLIHFLEQH